MPESVDISSGRGLRRAGVDLYVYCIYSAGEYLYRGSPGKILSAVSVFSVAGSESLLYTGEAEKFCILSAGDGPGRDCVLCSLCSGCAVSSLPVGRKDVKDNGEKK